MSPAATCQFGSLQIAYDERVLRPRPWTEMQSNWAAELSESVPPGPILELCAGAGQIGLLAAALTGRPLVQVDLNPDAAAFACENASAAGVTAHEFRVARLEAAVRPDERFPLILADPPYIPTADIHAFPDDPVLAVDGGEDGHALIDACLRVAESHLVDGGAVLLQVRGSSQADEVAHRWRTMRSVETRSVDSDRAVVELRRVIEGSKNG